MRSGTSSNEMQLMLPSVRPVFEDLPDRFKKIYFHLYSNSNTSRAERLVTQLALILLSKYAVEVTKASDVLEQFLLGEGGSANDVFLPLIQQVCPSVGGKELEFVLADSLIREVFREFGSLRLNDAPAHVVGEAFQALVGPRIRGDKGQFFTPRSIVRAMVEIVAPQSDELVLDPACGTGGFLVEVDAFRKQMGAEVRLLCGIEKDRDLFLLGTAMLRMATGERTHILHSNSLALASAKDGVLGFTGLPSGGFDVVLTNPPFGTKIGIKDKAVLKKFEFGRQWAKDKAGVWQMAELLRSMQDPQLLFLELCVRALKPGGRMGIVLPEGVFGNRSQGYVWEWLRRHGEIIGLLDCPRTSFQPGTDTKTNILFFRRGFEGESNSEFFPRVAVAIHCGHDRRGRMIMSDGKPYPNDFPRIASSYRDVDCDEWTTVKEFNPNYYVPRYYVSNVSLNPDEERLIEGAEFVTLRCLIDRGLVEVSKGHEPGSEAYGTGSVPFVRSSDLANYEVRVDPTKSLSEAVYKQFAKRQNLRPQDILMVVDGRYRIGSTAMLHEHDYRCVVQSHVRILRASNPCVLDAFSLLFALHLPSVHQRLRNLVFIQSTLGTLGRRLFELQLPLLVGDGPWTSSVLRFKTALMERAVQLAALKSLVEEDVIL